MRIQRTSRDGITYQASFTEEPSQETLEALDAVAKAAIAYLQERETEPPPDDDFDPEEYVERCESCGAEVTGEDLFCPECGEELE